MWIFVLAFAAIILVFFDETTTSLELSHGVSEHHIIAVDDAFLINFNRAFKINVNKVVLFFSRYFHGY